MPMKVTEAGWPTKNRNLTTTNFVKKFPQHKTVFPMARVTSAIQFSSDSSVYICGVECGVYSIDTSHLIVSLNS